MTELLAFSPVPPTVPARVASIATELELRRRAVRETFSPEGGINRQAVGGVLDSTLRAAGFMAGSPATLSPKELDYTSVDLWTAVSIQAGRAMTNNGALLAVLAAASCPDVDWLILLVPERYKNSATYDAVLRQMKDLEVAAGIRLDLQGVLLVEY